MLEATRRITDHVSAWTPPAPTAVFRPDPTPLAFTPHQLVISQIYGGGGNSGAPLTNDFVELHNNGDTPVDLSGWSVQCASATGTTWQVAALSGTLQPGHYYLLELNGGSTGAPLPTPDATAPIFLGATAGKIALVDGTTALSGSDPHQQANVADFVGFGPTTNAYEHHAAPAASNSNAIFRNNGGLTDTDDNSSDFAAGAPNPRNTSSTGTPVTHNVDVASNGDYQATQYNDVFRVDAGVTGASVAGFTDADQIELRGVVLAQGQLLSPGAPDLGLRIDTDRDGFADTGLRLTAPLENATLYVIPDSSDTYLVLQALLPSTDGNDRVTGTDLMNYLGGGGGKDVLHGRGGNDALDGGAGNDKLNGGSGTDWLSGGSRNNKLTGASGTDVFVFETSDGPGRTTITDLTKHDVVLTDSKLADPEGDNLVVVDSQGRFDLAGGRVVVALDADGAPATTLQYQGHFTDEATGVERYVYATPGSTLGVDALHEHLTTSDPAASGGLVV